MDAGDYESHPLAAISSSSLLGAGADDMTWYVPYPSLARIFLRMQAHKPVVFSCNAPTYKHAPNARPSRWLTDARENSALIAGAALSGSQWAEDMDVDVDASSKSKGGLMAVTLQCHH